MMYVEGKRWFGNESTIAAEQLQPHSVSTMTPRKHARTESMDRKEEKEGKGTRDNSELRSAKVQRQDDGRSLTRPSRSFNRFTPNENTGKEKPRVYNDDQRGDSSRNHSRGRIDSHRQFNGRPNGPHQSTGTDNYRPDPPRSRMPHSGSYGSYLGGRPAQDMHELNYGEPVSRAGGSKSNYYGNRLEGNERSSVKHGESSGQASRSDNRPKGNNYGESARKASSSDAEAMRHQGGRRSTSSGRGDGSGNKPPSYN